MPQGIIVLTSPSVIDVYFVSFDCDSQVLDAYSLLSARETNRLYLILMLMLQEHECHPRFKKDDVIVQRLDSEI